MIYLKRVESFLSNINKQKILFVWIPKNAGTSVFESLNQSLNMKQFLKVSEARNNFYNHGAATFGHIDIVKLKENGIVSLKYYNTSFKFCFSRNPYDRFLSLFHYFQIVERIPLNYNYQDLMNTIVKGIDPIGLYNFKGLSQCNKQSDWIKGIKIDKVYQFEDIGRAFDDLSNITGKNIQLIHKNSSSNSKDRRNELNPETVKMIQEFYEADFLQFNYSFNING
ncbi:sulfotransferase family protein [Gramella sp. Hel_I_59]|uniref:sulfotransferase family 2 domain-containing protein n=1 Tax=Gramella sp. Hel_I_59 TaxID=1249978 RepID=UPI00114EE421|nr:sulfotransferase family 2 domain-containing protein [Gramella sp. Hel_I_59]TQI71549.1 sulfotransferase family protein [Gramella sp. Hel_I_59]